MKNSLLRFRITAIVLLFLVLTTALLSIRFGAVKITPDEIVSALKKSLLSNEATTLNERIFLEIRLPRVIISILVGASLAIGGVLMQALFRNPVIEPGFIGTSSGAAFGAAMYFVLGSSFSSLLGEWMLPAFAIAGSLLSTIMVLALGSKPDGSANPGVIMLLTGIAVNSLFLSGVGFLSYMSRDPQARSITFWSLGTLSGASWKSVTIIGLSTSITSCLAWLSSNSLNSLLLGEEDARYLGVHVRRLKIRILLLNVILVGIATAFVGVIGFVGLIVPHILRFLHGADNRYLIPNSALLGALLLTLSDLGARLIVQPAELPIGIVTSLIGVPVFIFLVRSKLKINS